MAGARAVLFDAYGTLFDVHSVIEAGRAVTDEPLALSMLWRQKQLEYTWLRSLMSRYEDFWTVTESALRFALRRRGIAATGSQVEALMEAYLSLAPFPDVPDALARLGPRPLGILSNGSPRMLQAAVRSSGLAGRLRHVLSVDAVRVYKPAPAVYALGIAALGLAAATGEELDKAGNIELRTWLVVLGAVGAVPADVYCYEPSWHHGNAVLEWPL